MRRRDLLWLGLGGAAVVAAAGFSWRAFAAEVEAARARTVGRSRVIPSRFGALEYAEEGAGPPVLMIHGTGGGFDQGLAMGGPLAARRRLIAPSRFGYLASAYPDDPSSENQADAFVDLLDALGIERAAVVGGSAGALSALAFALRHPDRTSALVALVPAAHAPGRPPVAPPNPLARAIIERGLRSDLLFWLGMKLSEDAMIASLLATDPALVHAAEASEQARVRAILRDILPVSDRARGLLNDGRLAYTPAPIPDPRGGAPHRRDRSRRRARQLSDRRPCLGRAQRGRLRRDRAFPRRTRHLKSPQKKKGAERANSAPFLGWAVLIEAF